MILILINFSVSKFKFIYVIRANELNRAFSELETSQVRAGKIGS